MDSHHTLFSYIIFSVPGFLNLCTYVCTVTFYKYVATVQLHELIR